MHRSRTIPTLVAFLYLVMMGSPGVAAASCSADSLFSTPAPAYPVGPSPHDAAIADFNEDGILDVAVVNSAVESGGAGAHTVTVRLGTGGGSFGLGTNYPTETRPYGVVAADFNNDGIVDLAVSCAAANTVDILLGQGSGGVGNGTFAAYISFGANSSPYRLAVGDYNEDGRLDLVILNNTYTGAGLTVRLGQSAAPGSVSFGPPSFIPLSSAPAGLTTADFDEDGILDLAATIYDGGVLEILRGQGTGGVGNGTFAAPTGHYATTDGAFDIQAADLNEDGILDLVVGGNGGGLDVHFGLGSGGVGNGTFAPALPLGAGNVSDVEIGDFNGDGIPDIAVSGGPRNVVFTFRGQGTGGVSNGTFSGPEAHPAGNFCLGLASGDLDADSKTDLLSVSYRGSDFRTLLTSCPVPPSPYPHLDRVGDVPNDQGGSVFVVWQASALDGVTGTSVTSYRVWRRVPSFAPSALRESSVRLDAGGRLESGSPRPGSASLLTRTDGATVTYWEAVATLPAQRLPGYGYTAATTQDSLKNSNPFTAFFITALTADINTFYSSNVDSGYSVDNLPPSGPHGFQLTYSQQGAALEWLANGEPDLHSYRLYRGDAADFVPAPENLLADQTTLSYADPAGAPGTFYKLCAVDEHENESDFATAGTAGAVGAERGPLRLALAGPWPNPSRSGQFAVTVTYPHSGRLTFDVYDVRGTRVFGRRLEGMDPGTHTFTVGADRALRSGIYVIRVVNGDEIRETKTTVMR